MDAKVKVGSIIMFCDESVLGLQFGNGYSIVKAYLNDLPYKDKITDGRGQLAVAYLRSVKTDENGKYFFCLEKEVEYQMRPPQQFAPGVYTNEQLRCDDQVSEFSDQEYQFLHKMFSLLHIFKPSNIGTKQIFCEHKFSYGLINNTVYRNSDNTERNIIDDRVFSLTAIELTECNRFLADYAGAEYVLLKRSIDEFTHGLTAIHPSIAFEQFTTALEMTLLDAGQQGKKEVLSKRIAVLLENTSSDITTLHTRMKEFYRYRSESLHEGDISNITNAERLELEDIVRRVLRKCLERIKAELAHNASATWDQIKNQLINDLMTKVAAENAAGTFLR